MSRRGEEFRHRTAVFEGAFRAWSHLGSLDPNELVEKPASELDPIIFSVDNGTRSSSKGCLREYTYEPLPRSGLSHPYVKAVLSSWLGQGTDEDGVKLGLETLRTWWHHRKKGPNLTSIKVLNSDKMQEAVDEYTRHFFQIAHCLVVNDKEQPPRGLQMKVKKVGGSARDLLGHAAPSCSRKTTSQQLMPSQSSSVDSILNTTTLNMKGKCIPDGVSLPELVKSVSRKAMQMAHRGTGAGGLPSNVTISLLEPEVACNAMYGDPETWPIVYCSSNGDNLIALNVGGMVCAHCIKIVETVLKGCTGLKSPIDGLLDAAADYDLNGIVIKIDKPANAKRIAFEATRNLSLVGYKAIPIEIHFVDKNNKLSVNEMLAKLIQTFEKLSHSNPQNLLDWTACCTCPDCGIYRHNCSRHTQMHKGMFDHFRLRKIEVEKHIFGRESIVLDDRNVTESDTNPSLLNEQSIANEPIQFDDEQPIYAEQVMRFGEFSDAASLPLEHDGNQQYISSQNAQPFQNYPNDPTHERLSWHDISVEQPHQADFSFLEGNSWLQPVSCSRGSSSIRTSQRISVFSIGDIDWENMDLDGLCSD